MANWAKIKAAEKAEKGKRGALDGIPKSAPALVRATRAGEKAGAVGFDWPDAKGPRAKIDEELARARRGDRRAAIGTRCKKSSATCCWRLANLARKLGLDPESALRGSTDRFADRFAHIEEALRAQGRAVSDAVGGRAGSAVGRREGSVERDLSRASRYSVARMAARGGPDVVRLDAAEA